MTTFAENLASFPDIAHLNGIEITDGENIIHTIPAIEGKLGSLKLYHALALKFNNTLNTQAAEQGLQWFAEHLADAQANPGKHPNIDLLFNIQKNQSIYTIKLIEK